MRLQRFSTNSLQPRMLSICLSLSFTMHFDWSPQEDMHLHQGTELTYETTQCFPHNVISLSIFWL